MAKKYRSGVYLGETRRQRTARVRTFSIIAVLVLLTVIASVFFVAWLADRADDPIQTPSDGTGAVTDAAEGSDTAADAETQPSSETAEPDQGGQKLDTAYKPVEYHEVWSVMIDPGHGFDDIGTASDLLGEVNEATINLDIALRVREILSSREDVAVIMTHDDNAVDGRVSAADGGVPPLNHLVLLTPKDRAVLANGQDIDLFVSIHCDSLPSNSDIRGMRAYVYEGEEQAELRNLASMTLASRIADAVAGTQAAGMPTPIVKTMSDDDAFYVIRQIGVPSVLVEVGFVTNADDARNMLDEAWRQKTAEAIADGIVSYIGILS